MATVVNDYEVLECLFRNEASSLAMDLKIDGDWTSTDGDVEDWIAVNTSITTVDAKFGPDTGYEQRMRFQPDGGTWGSWSAWTTSRITHSMTVPSRGNEVTDLYDAQIRPVSGGSTLSGGGYIKIKKLDS